METMTARWTDDRMDDLKHQVDELGRRMEDGFSEQRSELNVRFDRLEKSLERVNARFDGVNARFDGVNARFDGVNEQIARTQETVVGLYAMLARFSLWFAGAVAVAVVGALLTLWLR
jgi:chromosome segregation ATPase